MAVLIIGLVGGAGWYVWQSNNRARTPEPTNAAQNQQGSQADDGQKTFNCHGKFTFEYEKPLRVTLTESDPPQCLVANVTQEEMPPVGPLLPNQLGLFFSADKTTFTTNEDFLANYTKPVTDGLGCCSLELRSQENLELDNGEKAILAQLYGGHPIEHEFYFFVYVKDGAAITTSFPTSSNHKATALNILKSIE